NLPAAAPQGWSQPVYEVMMPPLRFNADSPPPPIELSAANIVLLRSVRVQEGALYSGTVEEKPSRGGRMETADAAAGQEGPSHPGFFSRLGGAIRRTFGGSKCAGVGCG
ncbi:MAG: hypothetical protein ACRD5L_15795, partial [Bryobacteraceae bacterium]